MPLPRPAKFLVAGVTASGVVATALALRSAVAGAGLGSLPTVITLSALLGVSWVWPLILYRGPHTSEAHHFDEGVLVMMALLLPPAGTVLGITAATSAAQVMRGRPLVKSLFNFGMVAVSTGLAVVTVRVVAPPSHHISPLSCVAAILGAAVFVAINTVTVGAIVVATSGARWRTALLDGVHVRLMLAGGCVALGLMAALSVSAYPWVVAGTAVPFLILRQVLSGHYRARDDRNRVMGLFQATVDANASMTAVEVERALLGSARELLRSPTAQLSSAESAGELIAPLSVMGEQRWLTVAGRSKSEPFDAADQSLLDALAAVGAGALSNAALYEEGEFQRERLLSLTHSLGEGVCAVDGDGFVTFLNPAAAEMLGLPEVANETRRRAPSFLLGPAFRVMQSRSTLRNEDTSFHREGAPPLPVAFTASPMTKHGELTGAVIVFRDISERKAFEEDLARHAFHDMLTGLPNRRKFIDHLDQALLRSERSNEIHAVVFADVDRFKVVNDSLGHHAGDRLLVAIADRLRAASRPGDVLARFGGDEFTLLLEGISGPAEAVAVVRRILDLLQDPIPVEEGHELVANLSVGIATTRPGITRDDILHDADVAMYQAKAKGRSGTIEVFDAAAMGARSAERLDLETELRRALDHEGLEVFYQPVFDAKTWRPIGAEALVRWHHPTRGLLAPGHFIGMAEDTALVLPLGRVVLEQACRTVRSWQDQFAQPFSMGVNLSGLQFNQPALADDIEGIIAAAGVDPTQICLEITETLAMADIERTTATLHRLKDIGVDLAIDDFGTGYSSLGYLKQFPVDVVKIDQSFVQDLDTNPVDSAIVSAVIGLASAVGMTTIAEGVETRSQLEHLGTLGCGAVQGFYLGRPMRQQEMEQVLRDQLGGGVPSATGLVIAR